MMNEVVKKDDVIILRRLKDDDDLKFILEVQGKPENAPYIPQYRWSTHKKCIEDSDYMYLMVETCEEPRPVGYIILSGVEGYYKTIELSQIVISEKGKGYGRRALILIKSLAFDDLKIHRLRLEVRSNNPRTVELYKSVGFVHEGTLRECSIVNGRFLSLILMAILESEYYK